MSSPMNLTTEAEILKLARLLDVDTDVLDCLGTVPPEDVMELREHATQILFSSGGAVVERMGNAAGRLPVQLVATICERALGPMLTARAAAATDPAKAVDIARRLSPAFLTEVSIRLDPRRVGEIIAGVPASLVTSTAAELGRRREYVAMGRFLPYLAGDVLAQTLAVLDDEAILRTAFVLEQRSAVDTAIGRLDPQRLRDVLHRATAQDLWAEVLSLLAVLSAANLRRVAEVAATLPADDLDALLAAAALTQEWEALGRVVAKMSRESRRRMVRTVLDGVAPRRRKALGTTADRLGLRQEYDQTVGADS